MCGAEVGNSKVCFNCGADILLYKQIIYTSYVFYNQGLEKAKVKKLFLCQKQCKKRRLQRLLMK